MVVLLVLGLLVATSLIIIPNVIQQSVNFIDSTIRAVNRFISEPVVFNGNPLLNDNGDPIIVSEWILELSDKYFSSETTTLINDFLSQTTASSALSMSERVVQVLGGLTRNVVNISFRVFGSIAALALNTLFMMMLLSYFLSDGETMIENLIEIAPDGFERDLRRLFWELGQVWNDYLRGQLILGLLIGFIMWLLAFVLGLQNPLFLAMFAGFMEFIPNIGPVLAMLPPILVALISGSANFPGMSVFLLVGIIVVLWIAVQQLEGLVLQPRIMGSSLNLHPVVIVFGVIVGGSLGGVIGVILSAPTIATMRIVLQYVYGRIAHEPPFRENPNYAKWLAENAAQLRYEPEYVEAAAPQPAEPEPTEIAEALPQDED